MYARNDVKRSFYPNVNVRFVLAAARLRFAAHLDRLVARWLERCAANVETAQGMFPGREDAEAYLRGY